MMRLANMTAGLLEVPDAADVEIAGLSADSRRVEPGFLFLACRGAEGYGLDFLDEALARGAVAVLWEPSSCCPVVQAGVPMLPLARLSQLVGELAARFYGRPSAQLFGLGVTGTDGKTSVAHLFTQAAGLLGRRCAMLGTLGFGFLDDLHPATHTTPDPVSLQAWLARLRAAGADTLAMEVSSHALDQGRVNGVDLNLAVFTNLSRDHLDYHGDLRNYARAKRRLLERDGLDAVLINCDDDHGALWAAELEASQRVVRYGMRCVATDCDGLWAEQVQASPQGLDFRLRSSWGEAAVHTSLLGMFNVYNLLAVIGALLLAGHELTAVSRMVAQLKTVPGRIEGFRDAAGAGPLVVVDYAHTPGALAQVLEALRAHRQAALWCVFGCGGDRDRGKRPQMAAVAAAAADHLILTDDNPRSEDPSTIIAEMIDGIPQGVDYSVIHDRAMAIRQALSQAQAGDIVLVAGKGHEEYQQIGNERRPYSDRAVVAASLEQEAGRWTA